METDRTPFMKIDLVMEERERIKAIIISKIQAKIEYRKRTLKHKSRHLAGTFNELQRNILFLVDNPDYKRISQGVKNGEK